MIINVYIRRPGENILSLQACVKAIGGYNPLSGCPVETKQQARDMLREACRSFPEAKTVLVVVFYSRHIAYIERFRNDQIALGLEK